MPLAVGSRLGPYEILEPLGAGGMGEVYRARDAKLGRDVAIKVLPELFSVDRDRLARFQREAQVLASLNHQNIGHIYGIEDQSGIHALVLELVEGPTLADRIAQGPVPLDEAIPIARQIADALECAHEQGIIHRDLKPANIKLRPDGTVKVLDFGLAKALDPITSSGSDAMNSPTLTARGTQLGLIVGTAAYMAPEQARGKAVDRRADIWAFGVVLYEMLSGKRAFEGDDVSITLAAVLKDDVDWKALPKDLPSPVTRVLKRCLEKDPKRRLSAIGDARLELDAALQPDLQEFTREPTVRSSRWRVAAYVAVLLVGAALGALASLKRGPAATAAPPLVEFSITPPFQTNPLQLSLSPDGRAIAFLARETAGGPPKVWVRRLDNRTAQVVTGTDGASGVFWAPNGQRIGFVARNRLQIVDVAGGVPMQLCEFGPQFAGGTWNQGNEIVFSDGYRLLQISAAGGNPTAVSTTDQLASQRPMFPTFLPDGKRFLYLLWTGPSVERRGIYVASIGDFPGRRVVDSDSFALYAAGHLFYVRQGGLLAHRFDLATATVSGEPHRLFSGILSSAGVGRSAFAVAEGGVAAFRLGNEVQPALRVKIFDRTGKLLREIGEPGFIRQLRLSPDGKRLALERRDGRDVSDLYTMEVTTGISTRLSFQESTVFDPAWLPDGRLAYGVRQGAKHEIFTAAVGDTKGVAVVTSPEPIKYLNDWSPDGHVVLFHDAGGREVYAADTRDGKTARKLVSQEDLIDSIRFSPDGRRVAFQAREGLNTEVFVADYPSFARRLRVSPAGGVMPRWRRDGRELYYMSPTRMIMAVPVVDAAENAFGLPVPLFAAPVPLGALALGLDVFDPSFDGKLFFMISEDAENRADVQPITVVLNWLSALTK